MNADDIITGKTSGTALNFAGDSTVYNPTSTFNAKYSSDAALSLALGEAYGAFNGPYGWLMQVGTIPYVRAAMDLLGQDIPHGCGINCGKADQRRPANAFQLTVKYLKQYNIKRSYTAEECELMNDTIDAMDEESLAVQKGALAGGIGNDIKTESIIALDKIKSNLRTQQTLLGCKGVVNSQEQEDLLGSVNEQITAASKASDTSEKATKYIVWGMLGVVVIVTLIVAFKSNK